MRTPTIKYDGVPGFVVGHCYWVDGDMMPKVGGNSSLTYTPIVGETVEFHIKDATDEGTYIPVKSTSSDESGQCEIYLPPGEYRMCAGLNDRRGCSFDFLVRAGEEIDVDVRINRSIVY